MTGAPSPTPVAPPARPSPRHAVLFTAILVALTVGAVELLSYAAWKVALTPGIRSTVKALCRSRSGEPEKIPNVFWHHDLNPRHAKYRGLVNPKGTKGDDFAVPKPDGELRILCVGDSTVEGTGVAPHQTFPYQLEEMLKPVIRRGPRYRDVRVINAGVGSHNSAFNLAYLQTRLIHFQPDVVIIKSAYNDYLPYIIPGMQYDYTHAFPQPFSLAGGNPYWRLARHSYFLKILGVLLFRAGLSNPFDTFSGGITEEQFRAMDFAPNADKFAVYAENIRSMILTAKGRGMSVYVLDLPTSPDPRHYTGPRTLGARFRELIGRFESELRRVTAEEGVPFIATGPLDATDFSDHCHNTAAGNRKIATAVHDALLNDLGAAL